MTRKPTKIGYARVSTEEQSVDMQVDALLNAGVLEENIYSENLSGTLKNRPQLKAAMRALREGDTFVVWKLDRVARSMQHLLEVVAEFNERGVYFESVTDKIDTGTPSGTLQFHMLGAFAQFERDIIRERTQAGVDRAKAKGVKFGAKHIVPPEDMPKIWKRVNEKGETKVSVAKEYEVHVQTITRRLKEYEAEMEAKKPKRKKRAKK